MTIANTKYTAEPKILFYDIESAPILADVWGLWDNNVSLNQIRRDWTILSWSAKWLDSKVVMYADVSKQKDLHDDRRILKKIWRLLDEADIVVTQNGKKFDQKKLYARFIIHGMPPPSQARHIDTCQLAKSRFGFTSNKLEYLSEKLNKRYKKLKHDKFPGHELWTQCLARNPKAWAEMEKYNQYDVLALEELYKVMLPWETTVNFAVFNMKCSCGGKQFIKNGLRYTNSGIYQKLKCIKCGKSHRKPKNELDVETRKTLTRI
jgi:hypothetical protein